ncbi:PIN domain-containing protein [candidate division KSB1 bacterium]|nr:type II toxin-antitoxin system VapC family toxin [candidate division KSB1 bacterium]NIS24570.1 type II toxin-antitoxin system VapC family toxin [candidate division KSB1 bacterium]NIU25179.1 type II toxin-antitoxin system VapC family toxin [candidate division KSB1 bacterium]NIU91620.1 PIN domain-containing protein [candidate division KSB1 bacterium]NIV95418.1 PIN domain-containing protein [candidate division KSB1 bacterium]
MTACCVDASIVVKWAVKGEPHRKKAHALLKDAGVNSIILIAPPIIVSESDSAIRKRVFDGKMAIDEAHKAYAILDAAPLRIVETPGLRQRAREIAEQFNQRFVYDATYAALAELQGCEFWTADKAFFDAVKVSLPFVKYLPDYK